MPKPMSWGFFFLPLCFLLRVLYIKLLVRVLVLTLRGKNLGYCLCIVYSKYPTSLFPMYIYSFPHYLLKRLSFPKQMISTPSSEITCACKSLLLDPLSYSLGLCVCLDAATILFGFWWLCIKFSNYTVWDLHFVLFQDCFGYSESLEIPYEF